MRKRRRKKHRTANLVEGTVKDVQLNSIFSILKDINTLGKKYQTCFSEFCVFNCFKFWTERGREGKGEGQRRAGGWGGGGEGGGCRNGSFRKRGIYLDIYDCFGQHAVSRASFFSVISLLFLELGV